MIKPITVYGIYQDITNGPRCGRTNVDMKKLKVDVKFIESIEDTGFINWDYRNFPDSCDIADYHYYISYSKAKKQYHDTLLSLLKETKLAVKKSKSFRKSDLIGE